MRQFRGDPSIHVLLVAVAMTVIPAGAAGILSPAAPGPQYNVAEPDWVLSASSTLTEYGRELSNDLQPVVFSAERELSVFAGPYLIDYGYGTDTAPGFEEVVDHSRIGKAVFLIIFICGGLIRFFTSATYLKFVSEVLDPKAGY